MNQNKLLRICGYLMAAGLLLAAIGFLTGAQLNLSEPFHITFYF